MQMYPAIKARMGDWDYYIVRMTMREIAREVQLASQLWEDKTLSDAIQREIDQSRAKQQIVNFLSRRDDRFFSSLVVAAIGGNPTWTPLASRFGDSFGELSFETGSAVFCLGRAASPESDHGIDVGSGRCTAGVRRGAAIGHRRGTGTSGRGRRALVAALSATVSSLNRYAKPTDADTNIIMDEDDIVAIVTRRVITDHEFFARHVRRRSRFVFRPRVRILNLAPRTS